MRKRLIGEVLNLTAMETYRLINQEKRVEYSKTQTILK